jgi:hypothetical protein
MSFIPTTGMQATLAQVTFPLFTLQKGHVVVENGLQCASAAASHALRSA